MRASPPRRPLPAALVAWLSPLLLAATCQQRPTPSARDLENARIHYDLGVQAEHAGDVRSAVGEYQQALQYDPDDEQAENALGILYHLSFRRLKESEEHYQRALAIKPGYSEAKVNLGNLYLDQGRYDEAIALYEQALHDMFYRKPYLAVNNEGWAYYKKGEGDKAIPLIQEAVRNNPEFCQGYRNLGLIYLDTHRLDMAQVELDKYVKKCPDSADAHYELGLLRLKQREEGRARESFARCRDKSKEGEPLLEECTRLAGGGP